MHAAPLFIGDELAAAGYRLAGARVRVPKAGEEAQALSTALGEASLVLISADVAQRLPASLLADASAALRPLLLVVPATQGQAGRPDIALRLRAQLGLAA